MQPARSSCWSRRAAQRVARFLYCSSSEVYGNCGGERLAEETTVCAPTTVYGAAKLAGEYYAQAYQRTYGLPVTIVRPFNSYGPRAHHQGDLAEVIPRFVIRALNGEPPVIFGNWQQRPRLHLCDRDRPRDRACRRQ